jgi:succinyl-CoA synthetase beta subunit
MAFKIDAKPTFRRTVVVRIPDGGAAREETLQATFNVLSTDEMEELDVNTVGGSSDFLRRAIVRLDDLADANGKAVEYTEAVLNQVLQMPHARLALARTYMRELLKEREGN